MQVVKRDGTTENVDFSKVEKVLVWAVKGTSVDYREIFDVHNVNEFFFDGIHTSKIQELLANKASTKIVENRDWDVVAARLVLQRIRKEAHNGSTNYITLAEYFDNVEREGNRKLDDYVFNFDLAYLDTVIDQDADLLFTYLGITTLFDRYLLKSNSGKILEAPQHFLMRVAMGLTYNEENPTQRAEELYKLYAAQEFINSTPTLFNSATLFPQLSSCYGNTVKDDSLEGIFATGEELAQCSKFSGGTACDMTPLRAKGSSIGSTGGKSGGIVSYAKLYEQVIRGFDQGGKRPGVVALYLETWHKDIKDFLLSADPSRDERLAVRDVFLATWNSDLFMQRVKDGASWTLFSPSDTPDLNDKWGDEFTEAYERYERELPADKKTVVTAREVWGEIIRCLFERKGKGWPCFKDTSNARNTMRKIGTVHNSNLCVAPETLLFTDQGHIPISELQDQNVNVWNGTEWSSVTVVKTAENADLLKVSLSDGKALECTPYHKWYVVNKFSKVPKMKRTVELEVGDKIIKSDYPVIEGQELLDKAYINGFYSGDGCSTPQGQRIYLYGEKQALSERFVEGSKWIVQDNLDRMYKHYTTLKDKYFVPNANYTVKSRLDWLSGYLDADGCIHRNGSNESITASSTNKQFLLDVSLMLQTLGVPSKVTLMRPADKHLLPANDGTGNSKLFDCSSLYRLLISSGSSQKLLALGLTFGRLSIAKREVQRDATQFVTVTSVQDFGRTSDTYCVAEPLRHMATFNGILTGNCTEIILRNSSDRMFVCNLGSINLANVKSKEQLEHIIRVAVRTLDNTISNGFVPTESGNAFNQEDRPLGLGVMGYVELLANFGIDYESSDHVHAAYNLFKFISYIATDESSNLGKEKGNFPTFDKSMWAEGELIQDTSNNPNLTNWMESNPPQGDVSFFEDLVSDLDWEALRAKASRNMRNSHLLAIAPTATIANILGTTSCIELPLKRVYDKSNASGSFFMPSPLHDKYPGTVFDKIATQVDHDWDILSAAARQVWIDQAQSLNVYVTRNVNPKEVSDLYIKGWEYGIKTFYYLKTEAEDVTDLTSKYATPAPVEELELTCEACQ